MAKFYGKIGYSVTTESKPGVWTEEVTERFYFGELNKTSRRLQSSDQVNDNINITNEISIIADPFAYQHFHEIKYVEYMGVKWKISTAEVKYPRLILSTGGVYNG